MRHLNKDDAPEQALFLDYSVCQVNHKTFSRRERARGGALQQPVSIRSKNFSVMAAPPNQFDFTLGQPLAVNVPLDVVEQTEGNTDLGTKGSFDVLLRQENRPDTRAPIERIPQKSHDVGLTIAATEDIPKECKSVGQWSVLSSNTQFLKIQDQEEQL